MAKSHINDSRRGFLIIEQSEASFCGDLGFDSRKFVINNETRRVWPEKVVFGKKWCLTQTPLPHTHGF